MSGIINAFVASKKEDTINQLAFFKKKLSTMDFLVTELEYNEIEFASIFSKLDYQFSNLNSEFYELALTKSNLGLLKEKDMSSEVLFSKLQNSKKKRNIGDAFKHIVSDNWKVDLVMTINIRSLKNFLVLRDSGAAWFQIRWLAQAIKEVTPNKYLDLIIKRNKK
jgi:thymidylate synthase (FAD)